MAKVVVRECGEPLVDVGQFCPKIIIKNNGQPPYLRLGSAKRLNLAAEKLPDKMAIFFKSGWRSVKEQEEEFKRIFLLLKKKNPKWTLEEIKAEASKYVAPSIGPNASGHLTGGPADLGLISKKTGLQLPMFSSELSFQENAKAFQPKLPRHMQINRYTLFLAMLRVGFVGVRHEWWHWSYGDRTWAEKKGQPAIYDIIKSPKVFIG